MVLKKSSIQIVKYGTIIKCEGIIKAVFENPKADQNTLFFTKTLLLANDLYTSNSVFLVANGYNG